MDAKLKPEAGTVQVSGTSVSAEVVRGPESWQFFAFVFAALTAVAFALIDDLIVSRWWRLGAHVVAALSIGYGTLLSPRGRNWLVSLLGRWKIERG